MIRTFRVDKYGRLLADLFYFGKDSSPNTLRPRGERQGARAEGCDLDVSPEDIIAGGAYLN